MRAKNDDKNIHSKIMRSEHKTEFKSKGRIVKYEYNVNPDINLITYSSVVVYGMHVRSYFDPVSLILSSQQQHAEVS